MRILAVLITTLVLAGCKPVGDSRYADAAASNPMAMIAPPEAAPAPPGVMSSEEEAAEVALKRPEVPAGPPQLAYSYTYGLAVAPRHVAELVAKHQAACAAAGRAQCEVIGSSVSEMGRDAVRGQVSLRATPAWLTGFRARLAGEAKSAGGRLESTEVTSEDLSRQIVDTAAALKAKTTLRDRLQALLASRPGKVSELLAVERELARVQGEIDAAQSELAVMRGRVAMSDVTLNYSSTAVLAPQGAWSPLARAIGDFLGIVAATIAAMIRFIGWTLPWVLVAAVLLWIFRRRLSRLRWPWRRRPPQA